MESDRFFLREVVILETSSIIENAIDTLYLINVHKLLDYVSRITLMRKLEKNLAFR